MEPAQTTVEPPSAQRHRIAACLQPPGQGFRLEACAADDPGRTELESYVQAAFQAKHGATVRTFMPTLIAFRDRAAVLRGVVGVRDAGQEGLYLEHYLDRPVEEALAVALAARGLESVPRARIAEVGNLAGNNCRAAVRMVAHIPAYLMSLGYEWIVFTATGALQQILAGFGAPLVELARADGASVAQASDDWGRYYETDPRVYAGRLADADRLAGFARRGTNH